MELKQITYNNVNLTLLVNYKENETIEYSYFINNIQVIELTKIKEIYIKLFEVLKNYGN
jgi:hypothetical protein